MFDPSGDWVHTYRIQTGSDEVIGLLRLERTRVRAGGFTLKIHQKAIDDEGRAHEIDAAADCRLDATASLVSWKLTSRFFDLAGEATPALASTDAGRIDEDTEPVTSDWCLFEAVQRMDPIRSLEFGFELLEALEIPRGRHRLRYRAVSAGLYRFLRTGPGTLPCEYCLDETHQLVSAVSGTRTYALDEGAAQRLEDRYQRIYGRKTRGRVG